jgi:hypothetical protein
VFTDPKPEVVSGKGQGNGRLRLLVLRRRVDLDAQRPGAAGGALVSVGRLATSPADPAPCIHDFDGAAARALEAMGVPDWLAERLADAAATDFHPDSRAFAALRREVNELLERAVRS